MSLPTNPFLRPAQPADAAAIAHIYNHTIRNTFIPLEEQPVKASQMADRVYYAVTHPVGMVEKALRHLILSGYDR